MESLSVNDDDNNTMNDKEKIWFVTYETTKDTVRVHGARNIILTDEHPVLWAARKSANYRADGWVYYLLFFCEVPSAIAHNEEVQSWVNVESEEDWTPPQKTEHRRVRPARVAAGATVAGVQYLAAVS